MLVMLRVDVIEYRVPVSICYVTRCVA